MARSAVLLTPVDVGEYQTTGGRVSGASRRTRLSSSKRMPDSLNISNRHGPRVEETRNQGSLPTDLPCLCVMEVPICTNYFFVLDFVVISQSGFRGEFSRRRGRW